MITPLDFARIVDALGSQAVQDISWAEGLQPPRGETAFALETIYVICNSGMKNTVARGIFERVRDALYEDRSAHEVFRHKGKAGAIDYIWRRQGSLFFEFIYRETDQARLDFLGSLPWIGEITKYHLAKNFGVDVAKPDRHLERLAAREGVTPQQLCERLAKHFGYRVATVDTVIWRACANGLIDSRTGEVLV